MKQQEPQAPEAWASAIFGSVEWGGQRRPDRQVGMVVEALEWIRVSRVPIERLEQAWQTIAGAGSAKRSSRAQDGLSDREPCSGHRGGPLPMAGSPHADGFAPRALARWLGASPRLLPPRSSALKSSRSVRI